MTNDISDLNILYCYNKNKLGAVKRADVFAGQLQKIDVEIKTTPADKIDYIDDEFTHLLLDKTVILTNDDIVNNSNIKTENKLVVTNCHRDAYHQLPYDQLLINDFQMPNTICRYNLQYQYENNYSYIGPLVKEIQTKEQTNRLLVLSGHIHLYNLAKYIVEHANDVRWIIAANNENVYKELKDINNYDHKVIYTRELESILPTVKYVVHYGSHQLALECAKNNIVQLIIPPYDSRYFYQHAYRVGELFIGSYAYDFFHNVPIERKYRIVRSIRCNYGSYRIRLQEYLKKVSPCTPQTTFIKT